MWNNYSYKFLNNENSKKTFYKYKEQNWIEIKSFDIADNKLDLFIPNFNPFIRPWVLRLSIKYSEQVGKNLHLFPSNGEIKNL